MNETKTAIRRIGLILVAITKSLFWQCYILPLVLRKTGQQRLSARDLSEAFRQAKTNPFQK